MNFENKKYQFIPYILLILLVILFVAKLVYDFMILA